MKKKLLFLIPNLKPGGAEKVLVNLVNNLDWKKYDITLQTLFDVGVHRESLKPHIRYRTVFPFQFRGNTIVFKMFSPRFWWNRFVKERYDIAVSYLEGPTSRILGGCPAGVKKVAWVHIELKTPDAAAVGFCNPTEAERVYNGFNQIVAVSQNVKECFCENLRITTPVSVLYNTNETEQILEKANEPPKNRDFVTGEVPSVCTVARMMKTKGFDRLLNAHKRLLDEGLKHHIYILGVGEEQKAIEQQMKRLGIEDSVTLLGFQKNPYQYVSRCDLYVCSSRREGFSTAVTEALILGTPVVSTDCSGARELLGEQDEYGLVVENSEEGVYQGMKKMLSDPALLAHYKEKARERGSFFSRTETVRAVEEMLDGL
ncbi:MAG: glycosyltransferase [Oscillospiraceae bacterium]|nr:glycosyltransferase [Oscillospiraceae bacterium]